MGRLAEQQRKLLLQLMGPEAMGIMTVNLSMDDPRLCRPFLAGICPHDLFTNTKMDLGACPKTHSVKLKDDFEAQAKLAASSNDEQKTRELNRLRADYETAIRDFVEECDRRIRAAHRRLEKTPEENNRTTALMREIGELEGAYQSAMADVEALGSQGKVDESMAQLTKAEALKAEKQDKERELQQLTETSGASGTQKLRVCDICGAYLSILDSDRRLADHFGGKMHLGYLQLRQLMDDWNARGPLPVAPSSSGPPPPPGMNGAPRGPPPVDGPGGWGPPRDRGPPRGYGGQPQGPPRYDDRGAGGGGRYDGGGGRNGDMGPPPSSSRRGYEDGGSVASDRRRSRRDDDGGYGPEKRRRTDDHY